MLGIVVILATCGGCGVFDSKTAEVGKEKAWSSARYNAAAEAWVFKNFYSRVNTELASIGYTVPVDSMKLRTELDLFKDSVALVRAEFGDAYYTGSIVWFVEDQPPQYVVITLNEYGNRAKCALLLRFTDLFDSDLKLSDYRIINELPAGRFAEIVEKWKATGEWQAMIEGIE